MRLWKWICTIALLGLSFCYIPVSLAVTTSASPIFSAPWESLSLEEISPIAAQLFKDPASPVIGNPNGDVTVVEFLDYQCPHCKEMEPIIDKLINSDNDVRIIIKEVALFDGSDIPAKAALASQKQGKFIAFHEKLLTANQPLTRDAVLKLASQTSLDVPKLTADMQLPLYENELSADSYLAHQLNLLGTPSFLIAKVTLDPKTKAFNTIGHPILISGGIDLQTFRQAVLYTEQGESVL